MMTEFMELPLIQPMFGAIGLSILQLLLFFSSLWLIFLILIQRGKGGGLTAAFGGGGGDSAFGAKAGDAFTKITIISSLVWITLCMVTIARYNPPEQPVNPYALQDEIPASSGASLGAGDSTPSATGDAASGDASSEGDAAADGDASEDGSESETTDGGSDETSDQ